MAMFNSYFDYLDSIECENEKRILDGYEAVEALPKHEAIKRGIVRKPELRYSHKRNTQKESGFNITFFKIHKIQNGEV